MNLQIPMRHAEWWLIVVGCSLPLYAEAAVLVLVALLIARRGGGWYTHRALLIGFGLVALQSSVMIALVGYHPFKFLQQFLLLGGFISLYYIFFSNNAREEEWGGQIWSRYLRYTYFLAWLALLQFAIYAASGWNIFQFIRVGVAGAAPDSIPTMGARIIRVSSLMTEPGQFSLFITPSLAFHILGDRRLITGHKLLMLLTVILTFSTATYAIVTLIVVYKYLFLRRSFLLRTAVLVAVLVLGEVVLTEWTKENVAKDTPFAGVVMKLGDSVKGFGEFDPQAFELLNLSSYATLTNLWVAVNAPYRLVGTGLGTHEQNYERLYQSNFLYYGLNKQEGFSFGNRLYSEFGVLGLLVVVLFIVRYHNRQSLINLSVLFYLLTILIRGGHYTRYGIIFFVFLYFYSGRHRPSQVPETCPRT